MQRYCAESAPGWRVEELAGLTPRQVASRLAQASCIVNLNSHEAFNTSVPEAMAAGCVVLCYEAVGGQDFLADGVNALVFPNHHVYPLIERLQQLIAGGLAAPELLALRLRARAAVARFSAEATGRALVEAFAALAAPVVSAP
jgi:glycosyltransferase involved in cell wall biosynthesis